MIEPKNRGHIEVLQTSNKVPKWRFSPISSISNMSTLKIAL